MDTIIFFTKSVSIAGGKEKVLAGLANYLDTQGYLIKIVTYDGSLKNFFALNSSIQIEALPLRSADPKKNTVLKFFELYKDIRSYKNVGQQAAAAKTIIATDYLIASVLFLSKKSCAKKMVVWEHLSYTISLSTVWAFLRKNVYSRIKCIVALNKEELQFYKNMGSSSICIANPVEQRTLVESSMQNIVWVGALTKDKGIDDLLELGIILQNKKAGTPIHIYGGGECLQEFSDKIKQHNLQDILVLKGTTKGIDSIYANAGILIVTSKHECFPTVILEAFSFGIPAISFDCPTGPRNIITEGKDGYLIPQGNVMAMAEKIEMLLNKNEILKTMSKAAHKTSEEYKPEMIYPQWRQAIL